MPTAPSATPTPRQSEILAHIRRHIAARGVSPTFRELMALTGIRSPNGIVCHLRALQKKGHITYDAFAARSIRLTGPSPASILTAVSSDPMFERLAPETRRLVREYLG